MITNPACTTITARWCPVHGQCGCAPDYDLDDRDCPLHAHASAHAGPWLDDYAAGMLVEVCYPDPSEGWDRGVVVDVGSTGVVVDYDNDTYREPGPDYVTDPARIRPRTTETS